MTPVMEFRNNQSEDLSYQKHLRMPWHLINHVTDTDTLIHTHIRPLHETWHVKFSRARVQPRRGCYTWHLSNSHISANSLLRLSRRKKARTATRYWSSPTHTSSVPSKTLPQNSALAPEHCMHEIDSKTVSGRYTPQRSRALLLELMTAVMNKI